MLHSRQTSGSRSGREHTRRFPIFSVSLIAMWLDHSEPSILLRDAGSTCIFSDIFSLRSRILKSRTAPLVFLLRFLGRGWDWERSALHCHFHVGTAKSTLLLGFPGQNGGGRPEQGGLMISNAEARWNVGVEIEREPSRGGAKRKPNRKDAAKESGVTLHRRSPEVLFPPYRSWMRSNAQPRAAAVALTGQWSATTNAETEPRS